MPVPGFLTSFADKAQNAISASPLANHIPGSHRPSSTGPDQTSANEAAAQGGSSSSRSHALESIQYQLRAFGQQYSSASPVQKIITTEKGVAIDFDSVAGDAKSQSKEMYTWGQSEADDLRDVTDRLAYLNFVQGSLASSLAAKLNSARSPFKTLRDAESSLQPRRNIRAGFQTQISRIEHDQQKGMERKLSELRDQLAKAERDDEGLEKEVELLKRKAVRESEQLKWEAFREYGEKLALLSQAATPIIDILPTLPPSQTRPYTGTQTTAAARASLQRALDNYKTGHINLPAHSSASDLSRSDTRSFGETHASELSSISSDVSTTSIRPGIPVTPPSRVQYSPPPHPPPSAHKSDVSSNSTSSQPPPINPYALNQSPASIPVPNSASSPSPPRLGNIDTVSPSIPSVMPTVAETGVPLSAVDKGGPGPASGSLHDIKGASATAGPRSGGLPGRDSKGPGYGSFSIPAATASSAAAAAEPGRYETAGEEKSRLEREERERILAGSTSAGSSHETAEEEKKRLEREDRERTLRTGGGAYGDESGSGSGNRENEDDLPPYQEI